MKIRTTLAAALAVLSIALLCAGCSIRWSNRDRDGEWHDNRCYQRLYIPDGTNGMCELGFRSDGVVVWRKRK